MAETVRNLLGILEHYQNLKLQMLELLNDEDLAYTPPGCLSLGALCKEMGETEQSYVNSFKTLKLNFDYRNPDESLAASTSALAAWYANMDKEMADILAGFSEEDFMSKPLGRGNWMVTIEVNLDIYLQAILIFCGKAWVYLKGLGKPMPEQWADWLG